MSWGEEKGQTFVVHVPNKGIRIDSVIEATDSTLYNRSKSVQVIKEGETTGHVGVNVVTHN